MATVKIRAKMNKTVSMPGYLEENMNVRTIRRRTLLLAACSTTVIAAPAFAQEADGLEAPEDVVIVTATRRATGLQDVPVAVTALSAAQLSNSGVRTIQDLTQLAPSLNVPQSENSASVTARIRGVGTQGSNPGLESSVGVFVDGVYRARNGVAFGDLGELSAVEVLRGPQGTLFGRNTSAGLLNVNTKAPSFEQSGGFEASLGNYSAGSMAFNATGPISDTLAYRFYGAYRTRDGWMVANKGTQGEDDTNDQNYYAIRGQLLWQPSDDFSVRFIADQSEREEACCGAAVYLSGPLDGALNRIAQIGSVGGSVVGTSTTNTLKDATSFANRNYDQTIGDRGVSAEVTWELGFGTFTSISAWRNWEWRYGQDADFTGVDIVYRDLADGTGNEFTTTTQEFRLAGEAGPVDWLVGAFYSNEVIDRKDTFRLGNDYNAWFGGLLGPNVPAIAGGPFSLATSSYAALANVPTIWQAVAGLPTSLQGNFTAGGGTTDFYKQVATSTAFFTHNIIEISDAMKATIGIRYTSEDKDFRADYSTSGAQGCRGFEQALGLNPAANAGALAAVVGTLCQPFTRSALDNLDHRQARTEREWSGVASISYRFAEGINSYASYSRGYKAGGFNLDRSFSLAPLPGVTAGASVVSGAPGSQTIAQPDTSFAAEFVDAYEIGLKTQLFDRALTANFAVYHQIFENFQLNTFTGISFIVTAVPEVVSQGLEMDFRLRTPIDGLILGGGYAYTSTEYTDNLGTFGAAGTFIDRNRGLYLLPGSQLTSAPVHATTATLAYTRSLTDTLELRAYLDGRYSSEYNGGSNLDPRKNQDGFGLINGRIGIATNDGGWEVELFGRNLTDERYAQIVFDRFAQGSAPSLGATGPSAATSSLGAFMGEPRTVGVTVRGRF
jgi:iron complex outermembrane recepter protein